MIIVVLNMKRVKKNLKKGLLVLLVCFETSFTSCQTKILKIEMVKNNPIEYVFNIPKEAVYNMIVSQLNLDDLSLLTTKNKNNVPPEILELFLKSNNSQDIFLWSIGVYGKSKIYHKIDGSFLDYRVSFYLHMEAVGKEKTKVSIMTIKPRIVVRKELLPRPPHFVRKDKTIPVEPSTIEEYEILLEIGRLVGEKDMPPLNLPDKN